MKKLIINIATKFELFGYFLKVFFKHLKITRDAEKLGYYTSIEEIPIYNWDKIEQGELKYLFKEKQGVVPEYFLSVIQDMFFQMEKVNMKLIEMKNTRAYLKNLYANTGNVNYLNQYMSIDVDIKNQEKIKIKRSTLNEKVNYIEAVFNSIGSVDVHKMSAGRFYSLLELATKKIESHGPDK